MRAKEFTTEVDLSRRGFLKGIGAAGAAAAMPSAAKATIATPAAKAPPLADRLFQGALDYYMDYGYADRVPVDDGGYDDDDDSDEYSDEDLIWDDSKMQPQGKEGDMPWGELYEIETTPKGNKYLGTASQDGASGIWTFEKDGKINHLELAWDNGDYGEVLAYSGDERDLDIIEKYLNSGSLMYPKTQGMMFDELITGVSSGEPEVSKKTDIFREPSEPPKPKTALISRLQIDSFFDKLDRVLGKSKRPEQDQPDQIANERPSIALGYDRVEDLFSKSLNRELEPDEKMMIRQEYESRKKL